MPTTDPIDQAERLVRVETKLDFVIEFLKDIPISPAAVKVHEDFNRRIAAIEKWQNKVLGAIVAVNVFILLFTDKIKGIFT